ncbi:MAG: hypothetical protein ACYDC0_16765 [Acidimicrobiales bacterium]
MGKDISFLKNAAASGLYIGAWLVLLNYAATILAAKHPNVLTQSVATSIGAS